MRICAGEPYVKAVREQFGANPVAIPRAGIMPLQVLAAGASGRKSRRAWGELGTILTGSPPIHAAIPNPIPEPQPEYSHMRSQSVGLRLGLRVLGALLQGFGIPISGVEAQFRRGEKVSFSFQGVDLISIDVLRLGQALEGRCIDWKNSALPIGREGGKLLVIDSVVRSNQFSFHIDQLREVTIGLDATALQSAVAEAKFGVSLADCSRTAASFKNDNPLTFAFSCIELTVSPDGSVVRTQTGPRDLVLRLQMAELDYEYVNRPGFYGDYFFQVSG